MEEKKKVTKEVEKFQNECTHKDGYVVKFLPQTNDVRRFCKICDRVIGYPSEQDLKHNGFI